MCEEKMLYKRRYTLRANTSHTTNMLANGDVRDVPGVRLRFTDNHCVKKLECPLPTLRDRNINVDNASRKILTKSKS